MKVSIIGSGMVGASTAYRLIECETVDEVVLLDIVEGMPQGKGLDMAESAPVLGSDVKIIGSNDYADMKSSDIIVNTAGIPRKPGMSRMDLLKTNININKDVTAKIVKYAPDSMILVVANPLDIMTYAAWKLSGFDTNKVFGMAGILDTARYRAFISMELGVSVEDINAILMGGHGDSMVPLPRFTTISGIPLSHFLPKDKIDAIIERTRKGGGEIVSLLKTGSAYYAPSAAVAQMIDAITKNKKRVLPVCAYLNGEYGLKDMFVGVPVILGRDGVERVIELDLTDDEKKFLKKSADEVRNGIKDLDTENLL
ncbi:MAG: malate dehydrogenase [Halobacteriota archaeon]|nr:malate dehydrogenase [Halobacteriota archaeon]